ncbi:hypothetical protein HNP37_003717 [Flavobacterium nitrogenifigens]|uniref:Uncharacterized protein n=2 Tax=Flavobacterium TaxID=237 RepID=A0A7W7N9N6_9FLAO|nr:MULTISPECIES: hypothetical protein [Flavobacterium]MBB4803642.1 hypothetical protein [Flavobacterium nitrogenifigens]MBB6388553.1 hypothetical protein [Flavobacterium notoginsengisoli]
MKFFLQYIIGIISITFIVSFGIQYLADNGLRNLKNTEYNDWKNIVDGKINSDIIVNGSSRSLMGYNSQIIGDNLKRDCFNISFNAGCYKLQEYKFDIYIKRNKKPKIVIQNIDMAHFGENTEIPDIAQFYPFVYNEDINSLVGKYENKFNLFKIMPLLKYNQSFKMLEEGIVANFSNATKKNATTFKGYCPQDRVFKIDYHNLKKLPQLKAKAPNEREIRILHKMIYFYFSRLDKDSKLIFVWMPENKMRLTKSYDLTRQTIVEELNSIQKKYKNVIFIDMAYDDISNHDEYYYDTFHLNETGANLFSKKVSLKINEHLN